MACLCEVATPQLIEAMAKHDKTFSDRESLGRDASSCEVATYNWSKPWENEANILGPRIL